MMTLLVLLLACPGLGVKPGAAHTLAAELRRHCVAPDALPDAYLEIAAYAAESRWPTFAIAYYLNTGTDILPDDLHVLTFDRTTGESRRGVVAPQIHRHLPAAQIFRGLESWYLQLGAAGRDPSPSSSEGALVRRPSPTLVVLDRDLRVSRQITGPLVAVLTDGRAVFQGPPPTGGLRVYNPHTNSDRQLFPLSDASIRGYVFAGAFEQVDDVTIQFRAVSPGRRQMIGGAIESRPPGDTITIVCKLTGFGSCEKSDK
jgi:hypothetical protein